MENAITKQVPFKLIPTNLKGVYSIAAPPNDFDPNTASATELLKNGITLRRPQPGGHPGVLAAWQKAFSRTWHAKDRIVPHFQILPPRGNVRQSVFRSGPQDSNYSNNWAGAVINNTPNVWNTVFATWQVPEVTGPGEPQSTGQIGGGWQSASWIGIDGLGTPDVLQGGIEQNVASDGQPFYYAWYEWYAPFPAGSSEYPTPWLTEFPYLFPLAFDLQVNAGDIISVVVQYTLWGTGMGQVSLANQTTGKHSTVIMLPPPTATLAGGSIEWILESPGGEPGTSIPNFGTLEFTGAYGCSAGTRIFGPETIVGNPQNATPINLIYPPNTPLTQTTLGDGTVTIQYIGP